MFLNGARCPQQVHSLADQIFRNIVAIQVLKWNIMSYLVKFNFSHQPIVTQICMYHNNVVVMWPAKIHTDHSRTNWNSLKHSIELQLWIKIHQWNRPQSSLYWGLVTYIHHDAIMKWKHFPRHWPFVWGIHWSPHYLNQTWFLVDWAFSNKLNWNLYQNTTIFIQLNRKCV